VTRTNPSPGPHAAADAPAGGPIRLARWFTRRPTARPKGLLAGLRIRKKLIVLHTIFSLGLLLLLIVGVRPAVMEVVDRAEVGEARTLAESLSRKTPDARRVVGLLDGVTLWTGSAAAAEVPAEFLRAAESTPGVPVALPASAARPGVGGGSVVVALPEPEPGGPEFAVVAVLRTEAREAVTRLFLLTVFALIGVYVFIAVALELFVLPQAVYAPIERLLTADRAVREGRADAELIPDADMPEDELGEIMRSRNESVVALRSQEAALAEALARLEEVANDLKRKNHLLETAKRNLADADRLASLGMMSAGLAHELNTPLAVLKGLAERLSQSPTQSLDPASAHLMLRVVGRLERLGESLLDFARARPPALRSALLREVAEEAITLVRLDRGGIVRIENLIPPDLHVECDADRMVQVLVNLIRNARNALAERPGSVADPRVFVDAQRLVREQRPWATITIRDNGPGIDPAVLPRLFEPFATTRLDARGTGLGLAVSEGIVREHGGILLARNITGPGGIVEGAEFEVMLPMNPADATGREAVPSLAEPAT
jgi:signal transduction histidine kinase